MRIVLLLIWLPFSIAAMVVEIVPLKGDFEGENLSAQMAGLSSHLNLGHPMETIESIFNASRHCELYRLPYLLFGSFEIDGNRISVELNLYDHESRSIGVLFYGSDNKEDLLRLAIHMVEKVESFLEARDLIERGSSVERGGPLSIPISLGYWLPLDKGSIAPILPLFSTSLGIRFSPLYDREYRVSYHFGAILGWTFSKNNSSYEEFYLHRLIFHLPLQLTIAVNRNNSLSVSLSPLYRLELLRKRRLNEGENLLLSHSFGLTVAIGYHYRLNRWFSGGFSLPIDIIFTDRTEVSLRPQLSLYIHGGDPRRSQ